MNTRWQSCTEYQNKQLNDIRRDIYPMHVKISSTPHIWASSFQLSMPRGIDWARCRLLPRVVEGLNLVLADTAPSGGVPLIRSRCCAEMRDFWIMFDVGNRRHWSFIVTTIKLIDPVLNRLSSAAGI